MLPEHGRGDGFEQRLVRPGRGGLAPPDRGQHGLGKGPRLADIQHVGIANDLPDAFATVMWASSRMAPTRLP